MASNLTSQVRNIADVQTAVAKATSPKDHGRGEGEILELKNTVNTMVDQLSSFAAEVTRVAREVERKDVWATGERSGIAGTWKDLNRQRDTWRRT